MQKPLAANLPPHFSPRHPRTRVSLIQPPTSPDRAQKTSFQCGPARPSSEIRRFSRAHRGRSESEPLHLDPCWMSEAMGIFPERSTRHRPPLTATSGPVAISAQLRASLPPAPCLVFRAFLEAALPQKMQS